MSEVAMRMEKKKRSENSVVRNENRSAGWENHTGIPTQLKDRIEQSTGLSLHDVRVHYNSDLPMKLDALAYTRGNQVEIGPGQERHLPHELGHVVQQKLGMVRANAMHSSGVALNTDPGLEHQADEIGAGNKVAMVQRMGYYVIQRMKTSVSKGSTGRTEPRTLQEEQAMKEVKADPLKGATRVDIVMRDSRWPATSGWRKMERVISCSDGTQVVIHFVYNPCTRVFDDFKFKDY